VTHHIVQNGYRRPVHIHTVVHQRRSTSTGDTFHLVDTRCPDCLDLHHSAAVALSPSNQSINQFILPTVQQQLCNNKNECQQNNVKHSDGLPEKQMFISAGRPNNYKILHKKVKRQTEAKTGRQTDMLRQILSQTANQTYIIKDNQTRP